MRFRSAVTALALLVSASFANAAPADDLKEAQRLYAQGKHAQSLEKVDAYLKAMPKEPQGRFLRGLLLTEQKRTAEAIQVFTGLTEDFPELPEPYNNLAVLYASQGNYEKAKSSLELAIHTHPSYATAHENLGDIYAQLASRAYDRALALDKNNTTAQVKLSMVKDLFSSQRVAAAAATPAKPSETKPAEPAKAEPAKAVPAKPAEPAKVEPPKVAAAKPAEPAKAAPPKPAGGGAEEQAITAMVHAWASAWSAKDVAKYLSFYAPEFEPPAGETRAAWEKQRTERIQKPKSIEVGVKMQSVKVTGSEATAVFRQTYASDTMKSANTKTLKLVRSGDRWLIKQERAGG
jgi:tetratricopeptide (TPR) repeat protein